MTRKYECYSCGIMVKDKSQVIVSRHTGLAWCVDEVACQRRQRAWRRQRAQALRQV